MHLDLEILFKKSRILSNSIDGNYKKYYYSSGIKFTKSKTIKK